MGRVIKLPPRAPERCEICEAMPSEHSVTVSVMAFPGVELRGKNHIEVDAGNDLHCSAFVSCSGCLARTHPKVWLEICLQLFADAAEE